MKELIPVILAGGSGERFWPLSRKHKPKQFLALEGEQSLLQATYGRLASITQSSDSIFVVTSNDYRSLVLEQLPEIAMENVLVEPMARDTAPAVLYAALSVAQYYPEGVLGIFPSDHRIGDTGTFAQVVEQAVQLAQAEQCIVTLGIEPAFPATGYGYIQRGEMLREGCYRVNRFAEKPDSVTAQAFLDSGEYSWNSGMFIMPVQHILNEYQKHQPELFATLSTAMQKRGAVREVFPSLQKISFDYAIMEKTAQVAVIPADCGWDDLGDWNALERLLKGEGQNVSVGRHVGIDTEGALMYTTSGEDLIVTIGLEDVVIVRTQEVTLVVRKDRTQDIKKVVQKLKEHPELVRFA